ncbi:MAG: hypothetical protein IE889_08930 [Campylobacterales bacterium]|nr:hypothetical protein [Campylobacterales bacterium]
MHSHRGRMGTRKNGANGTGDGINPIKLDFGTIASGSGVKCGYFEVKLK